MCGQEITCKDVVGRSCLAVRSVSRNGESGIVRTSSLTSWFRVVAADRIGMLMMSGADAGPAVVGSATVLEAIESIARLRGSVAVPERGAGWRTPQGVWHRLVGQICAIGSSRAWDALQAPSVMERLAIPCIRAEGDRAADYVHAILAEIRVRYCSVRSLTSSKAEAIAANAHSAFVADTEGRVHLLDRIRDAVGEPGDDGVLTPEQARAARRLLIREVRCFGPKSASDFLAGLGLADSLLALDVRLLNLLIDTWGFRPEWRTRVHRLKEYERIEEEVIGLFCRPLGIRPVELDQLLFYGYSVLQATSPQPSPKDLRLKAQGGEGERNIDAL